MVHYDRAADDEFLSEEELRRQIVRLRAGNVARHVEGDEAGGSDVAPPRGYTVHSRPPHAARSRPEASSVRTIIELVYLAVMRLRMAASSPGPSSRGSGRGPARRSTASTRCWST